MNPRLTAKSLLEKAGLPTAAEFEKLPGAGSDRLFYRVTGGGSYILMAGSGHGAELPRWLDINRFLERLGFGVPEVYAADLSVPALLVEDLGEMTPPDILDYPAVVRELARLARAGGGNSGSCPTLADNAFVYSAFRAESEYFVREYLPYRGVDTGELHPPLSEEFDGLAADLAGIEKLFCHRDFQSENICVDKIGLRIIDFQSAKLGPPEYDIASLLRDARVELDGDYQSELVEIYLDESGLPERRRAEFRRNLPLAALSRKLQALGAFSFLSEKKGKPRFRKLIPVAERQLLSLIEETGRLQFLKDWLPT